MNSTKAKTKITEIEVNGEIISDEHKLSNEFNRFFTNIGHSIVTQIQQECNALGNINFSEIESASPMYLQKTSSEEVVQVLSNLKKSAAPGYDNITVKDLILIQEPLVPILTILINKVFTSGIFPDILKIGRVIPIFKSGNARKISNYRPITNTCTLSKVVETIIKLRIIQFISVHAGFDKHQYGFLKNSNTLCAATDLLNYICTEMDKKRTVLAIFIDLKKAFDVVDHKVLLKKLYLLGIRGNIHSIIKTYLFNRPQYVSLNNAKSDSIVNACGVPQGSVLGPLLYTILVLSLQKINFSGKYFTFADDTVFLYSGSDLNNLQNRVNNDLTNYSHWLLHNRLKLNADKTVYMIFQQKNTVSSNIQLNINNSTLSQVQTTKYLGLIINEKLNWSEHIKKLNNKIIPMLGALHRCAKYLNNTNRYLIYNAYILCNVRYLINIWGTCGLVNMRRVQVLQNRSIKILFQKPYLTPTSELYTTETDLHSIKYDLEIEQCKQIYKILHKTLKCNTKLSINN